jgi:uncharacterized protein (DUF1501 family)
MLRIDAGGSGRYCDGMSRRSFVQLGVAGMAAAGLGDVARAKQSGSRGNDNAAILIWLDGGPSHLDTYDLKPKAPSEYRGIWTPIPTNVPGMDVTELFPLQAQHADKFSIVRSLHHDTGGHFHGGHYMLTTKSLGPNNTGTFPSIGSIVARERGPRRSGMPSYISVPVASSIGLRPGYFGGNWMGMQYDPFQTGGDPNNANFKVANLNLPGGMTVDRLANRRDLNQQLDRINKTVERGTLFEAMDKFDRDAFEFVSGARARKAFDINSEDPKQRDLYGRSNWGQSTMLARRLVEAGSTFVTVHFGGWDHHWNLESGYKSVLPRVDMAVSGLLKDLSDRGMLESTLVILCGEFSRTPRMNNGGNGGPAGSKGTPGRDHWGNSLFCLLAGGGIRGGQVIGSTNAKGERPLSRAVKPCNLHATIYKALGMDPTLHLLDHQGRPTPVLEDPTPIHELF